MRLKIASRKSDLARWQAVKVARAIGSLPEKYESDFIFKASFGDQNLDIPLAGMGARGVFTEDFHQDLLNGQCDLVVHSWKDLPVGDREGTRIAMTLPRADVRDILMIPESVWQAAMKSGKLSILTSSPRRAYNLAKALPRLLPGNLRLEFLNVRGNVPTRLKKMHAENAALVLAKAGLDRLLEAERDGFIEESVATLIRDCRFQVLPVSLNPPASAQGALAVEIAAANTAVNEICARLTDKMTFDCVQMEREVLQRYGGGCHQKIGAARLPRPYGLVKALRGLTDDGVELLEWELENQTPWQKAAAREFVFPLQAKENSWFTRKPLKVRESVADERALFVARAEALPEGFVPRASQIMWVAGVQTWVRLAERGVFVNGCSDGLGENEEPLLDFICGRLQWCKLTHASAPRTQERTVATYELEPKQDTPDITNKTHFFWMSRTSFERARQLFPREIQQGRHSCGPGHTYDFLSAQKDLSHPVKVFLGLEQFLHETLP